MVPLHDVLEWASGRGWPMGDHPEGGEGATMHPSDPPTPEAFKEQEPSNTSPTAATPMDQ